MVIYLKHPKHGTKVACLEEEAKADEKNGWERYTLDVPKLVKEDAEVKANPERDGLVQRYVEKFGKAPHHNRTIDWLKSELAA